MMSPCIIIAATTLYSVIFCKITKAALYRGFDQAVPFTWGDQMIYELTPPRPRKKD